MALKIVMDDMVGTEIAAMYQEGEDAVILVRRGLSDDVRCAAVNSLLARVRTKEIRPLDLARLLSVVA